MRAKAAKRAMFAHMGDHSRDKKAKQPSTPKYAFFNYKWANINFVSPP